MQEKLAAGMEEGYAGLDRRADPCTEVSVPDTSRRLDSEREVKHKVKQGGEGISLTA